MRKLILQLLLLACLMFFGSNAFALEAASMLAVEGRYWFSDIDANISVGENVPGTDIDFVQELGLQDEDFPEGRVTIGLGNQRIRYAYLPLEWEGVQVLARDISFGGQTFTASQEVATKLEVVYHRLGYENYIINKGGARVAMILELKYFDAEATLASGSVAEKESLSLPVPAIGFGAGFGLPLLLDISAEATGIGVSSDKYMVDAEAMVNFVPIPFMMVSAGYRYFDLNYETDEDLFDIKLKGPFLSAQLAF